MSLFGRTTFSAAGYAAARPSYPPNLFNRVLAFHKPKTQDGTLLDLGCGHGLIARALSPHFGTVIGCDPSAGMVKQATEMTKDPKITFRQSGAESLSFLSDNSVDLVVSGQAAHWFDYAKTWPELYRVVKPGGSMAFFGYKDNFLIGHPAANKIFHRFCYSENDVAPGIESMNKYWEKPGRDIVRNLLREVEPPASQWEDVTRILYDVTEETTEVPDIETAFMQKKLNLGGFEAYLRTFSAVQGWQDAHPDKKRRDEGGEGDLVDIMMDQILEAEPQWKALGDNWRDAEVETVWGTYILMARRKK